jgi:CHAT domain-containing protein/tetratricopeptide (TPR) repeat protein
VLSVFAGGPAKAEVENQDTPLQKRAKAVLGAYSEARTEDALASSREQLLAMADTLEAAGEDVLASECLERAGIVGYRFAEYDNAREIWDRGLTVARRSGDKKRIAALLNAQAIGVSVAGDNESAIALQLELVALRQELEDARGEGVSWHNLAYSYHALFRYPEAIEAASNAMRLHREAGNTYGLATSMSLLANTLFTVGQTQAAMAMADSAVARARELGDPSPLGQALQNRGRQRHYAGDYEGALTDYEEAHEVLTAAGVAVVAAVSDLNWANALISLRRCEEARELVDEAMTVLAPVGEQSALLWGECVSARIAARCGDADSAREELLATIDRLEAMRDSIPDPVSRAEAFRAAGGAYTDLALLEIAQGKPEEAWRIVETSTGRLFRDELGIGDQTPSAQTLAALQRNLAKIDGVALQFGHSTVDRNVVCLVTPTRVFAVPVVIGPGFRMDVAAALKLMSSGANDEQCRPVLERIAGVILAPVEETFAGTNSRLLVFPGTMAGFPVEALPMPGDGGASVGDRFAVTYAPSAAAFLHLESLESTPGDVVVFADPALGTVVESPPEFAMRTARTSLAPLPEARAEGEAVGRSGVVLLGEDATKPAFLERASGAAVVHVAAHALVDGSHPDHSGIVLAGLAGGDLLTVSELRGLTLPADLVSLSGCETAGGYVAMGEGAFGLTRAFLLAGTRSVVSSWWDVEDSAARRFMELYYEGLRAGASRDIALQHARRAMKSEGYPLRDRVAFALAGATARPVSALTHVPFGPGPLIGGAIAAILIVILATLIRRGRKRRANRPSA